MCPARLTIACVILLTCAVVLLAGCGGGGGGVPPSFAHEFSGEYTMTVFSGNDGDPLASCECAFATLTPDGAGTTSMTYRSNRDGEIDGPHHMEGFTYTIDAARHLSIIGPAPDQIPFVNGGLGAGGGLAIVSTVLPDRPAAVGVLVRRGGLFDAASFSGIYHDVYFRYEYPLGRQVSGVARTTFNGIFSWNTSGLRNVEGEILGLSSSGSYQVWDDGYIAMSPGAPAEWQGRILAGGEVAALGGSVNDTTFPLMRLLIRTSVGATASLFSGTYHVVSLTRTTLGYLATRGTFTASGAGEWTSLVAGNLEGTPLAPAAADGNYSVQPDGELNIAVGATTVLRGAVSPSGDFAVVGGSVTDGARPQIWIFVRP